MGKLGAGYGAILVGLWGGLWAQGLWVIIFSLWGKSLGVLLHNHARFLADPAEPYRRNDDLK